MVKVFGPNQLYHLLPSKPHLPIVYLFGEEHQGDSCEHNLSVLDLFHEIVSVFDTFPFSKLTILFEGSSELQYIDKEQRDLISELQHINSPSVNVQFVDIRDHPLQNSVF